MVQNIDQLADKIAAKIIKEKDETGYISIKDAAKELGITVKTLRRKMEEKEVCIHTEIGAQIARISVILLRDWKTFKATFLAPVGSAAHKMK